MILVYVAMRSMASVPLFGFLPVARLVLELRCPVSFDLGWLVARSLVCSARLLLIFRFGFVARR